MSAATEETRRTAFRTAYLMGAKGRELFLWVAEQDDPAARRAAVLSLYLHWRHDPAYVYRLMDELAGRVGLPPIGRNGRILRFLADLSITVYINHPEEPDVVRKTSDLWAWVFTRRLRLNQLLFFIRGPFGRQVGRAFSGRTLDTALLSELQPPSRFFSQTDEERARFLRTVPLVDPDQAVSTEEHVSDLVALLRSDILLHRILAALVIGIHAARDPKPTGGLIEELEPQLDGKAWLWTLLAYSVPLSTTPASWIPQLERMTRRLVTDQRNVFLGAEDTILRRFDIALLPLGLAYGKHGLEMPVISELLARGLDKDRPLGTRIVRGLASVGFYYPHAVFTTLQPHAATLMAPDAADSLAETLSAIRTLHFDRVDLFLGELHAPDAMRRSIAAMPEPSLIARCTNWIGYFNNAVHQALNHPAMLRTLLIGGLTALGEARKPSDFIGKYTDAAIDMAERAEFRLIRWTEASFDQPTAGNGRDQSGKADVRNMGSGRQP